MFWSKVFLKTVLIFSSISSDNAAQDMRTKGGELVPDFGWFSILNFILILNHHYHLCTYFVFQKGGILLFPFMNANGFYHTSLYVVVQSSQKIQVKNNDLPQSKGLTVHCFAELLQLYEIFVKSSISQNENYVHLKWSFVKNTCHQL